MSHFGVHPLMEPHMNHHLKSMKSDLKPMKSPVVDGETSIFMEPPHVFFCEVIATSVIVTSLGPRSSSKHRREIPSVQQLRRFSMGNPAWLGKPREKPLLSNGNMFFFHRCWFHLALGSHRCPFSSGWLMNKGLWNYPLKTGKGWCRWYTSHKGSFVFTHRGHIFGGNWWKLGRPFWWEDDLWSLFLSPANLFWKRSKIKDQLILNLFFELWSLIFLFWNWIEELPRLTRALDHLSVFWRCSAAAYDICWTWSNSGLEVQKSRWSLEPCKKVMDPTNQADEFSVQKHFLNILCPSTDEFFFPSPPQSSNLRRCQAKPQ